MYLPLVVFLIVLLFPFYWMAITAVKPEVRAAVRARAIRSGSIAPTLAHFHKLLFETAYPQWLWNTLLVSVVSTFSSLAASVLAAYAIERLRFKGSRQAGLAIFLAYLVPPSILFIPLADVVFKLGLFDTRWALVLTYPTFLIPFCTWLLMGYFRSIPAELEECALIDGASRWQVLVKIVLPLAVPGLISAGIFAFTLSWNEFIYALTFVSSSEVKTRAGRCRHGTGAGRRLPVGAADGRRAARLAAGGRHLLVLRRVLRVGVDAGRSESVGLRRLFTGRCASVVGGLSCNPEAGAVSTGRLKPGMRCADSRSSGSAALGFKLGLDTAACFRRASCADRCLGEYLNGRPRRRTARHR